MAQYVYLCEHCKVKFEEYHKITDRDYTITQPCPRCGEYEVIRIPSLSCFWVHEGACGNASNGYSSTVGDAENWKARSRGEKEPY